MSWRRQAARAATYRAPSVGRSSSARSPSLRAVPYASRAIARLAAFTSAPAVSWASSSGGAPSSSVEELDRLVQVVRADLHELVAGALREPLREARVVLRASELREPGVRDLADEQVLEAVGGLAGDRRARLAEQELAQEQVVEQRVDVLDVGREVLERALPEHAPDDRCALEKRLPRRRQMVDARGDERLERVGDASRPAVPGAALEQHADRLLDEQRVALGPLEQLLRQRGRDLTRGSGELDDELLDEQLALVRRERLQLDRGRAHAPSAPPRPRVEQLGPGEAEDEKRRADPVREVLDQVEKRLLGPVDVLEEENERLDVAERLHDLARRPGDLLRASLALERLEHRPTRGRGRPRPSPPRSRP